RHAQQARQAKRRDHERHCSPSSSHLSHCSRHRSVALRLLEVCLRLAGRVRGLGGLRQLQSELRFDASDGDEARGAFVVVSDQLLRLLQVLLRELEVQLRVRNGERPAGVGGPDVGLGGGPLVVRRRQRAAARSGGSDCSERKKRHRRDPHLDLLLSYAKRKFESPESASRTRHWSTFRMARNAFWGISTVPTCFIRFLPSFCFSSSFRLREISPP